MKKSVINFIEKNCLLNRSDKIIIGVSGGPDSVYLLLLLNWLRKKLSLNLFVAHVDYRLRKTSGKDALFVRDLSKSLDISFYQKKVSLNNVGDSLEQAARKIRFDYFLSLAKKLKANKIALAHNLDDQAETVLMRMIRGTGLYGLSAMIPKRAFGSVTIIRPLLAVKKNKLIKYLDSKKIKYRIDKTNKKDIYLRNKIRNKFLPLLKTYNPRIEYALVNLANNASLDYELIDSFARITYKRLLKNKTDKRVVFKIEELRNIHPSLLRLVIRFSYQDLKGDLRRFDFRHFSEVKDLIFSRPDKSIVHLPADISVQKMQDRLYFKLK
ncbi:MAG: tRNA lysidine(34) synthetase TilS [Candidatus Gygaella obscura]|nr:tRNA lysidine(34) synthetase TilS [Candidatus Gygaella obscura]